MLRAILLLILAAVAAAPAELTLRHPLVSGQVPTLLYKTDPSYTDEARRHRVEGTVLLYVRIGTDGRAHRLSVIRSLGSGLDRKAIEAVREWRFAPARKNGRPTAVDATIEVNFRLADESPGIRV